MKPTHEQLSRAYNQVRRPEWPWANADDLAEAKRQVDMAYTLTNACAVSMANGHPLPRVPMPIPAAAAPKPVQTPARPNRRRDDAHGYSTALAASGEYARHETDTE